MSAPPVARHDFPYTSRYVDVHGSRMHYVDEGQGPPVLFVHGNPTWSYLWRKVLPVVEPQARVVALDLIGFGKSDRPAIDYSLDDHVRHLEGFIEALDLRDLILVVHDWGSGLGFHYAATHPDNVRGIVFMEGILPSAEGPPLVPSEWKERVDEIWRVFLGLGAPEGAEAVLEDNVFIETMLPLTIARELTPDEHDAYREPFPTEASRKPILAFRQAVGTDASRAMMGVYVPWLQQSPVPKLMLSFVPGVIGTNRQVEWVEANLPEVTVVRAGTGLHFVQEDEPEAIGQAIVDWMAEIER